MALKSVIDWLYDPYLDRAGATWNRWYGCTRESSACSNCYISRQPPLRIKGLKFDKVAIGGKTEIVMTDPKVLYYPIKWSLPLLIFPISLGDLWHPAVPIERTAEMYAVMLLANWHIFITTTKRHRRQRNWLRSARFHRLVREALVRIARECPHRIPPAALAAAWQHLDASGATEAMLPLTNVWVGVTCEANENADRLRYLADTPAAVRWGSIEPVTDLGLDLDECLTERCERCGGEPVLELVPGMGLDFCDADGCNGGFIEYPAPDWFVFGGESGPPAKATELDTEPAPGLRPLDLGHLEFLIDQVHGMRTPTRRRPEVFVKQLGEPWAVQAGAASRAGRDMSEWPEQLQVRRYPVQLAERALRFDPDNALALADAPELAAVSR